jgi:RNA-directed DNA polymerase
LDPTDPTTEQTAAWQPAAYKGVALPRKLATLRQKLYLKAKQEPKFRFYALYDRIYRRDVLAAAYAAVRSKRGAPGVDGVSFEMIEADPAGPEALVEQLHEALRTKTYKPDAVRRVYIPKSDGRLRPLGIPTIRDRVVQMAALLILEPIFEADFLDCSYGFRPSRSAKDALAEIQVNLRQGRRAVYDADLKGYFDSIPHEKLLACVRMRVVDRSVLKLIRQWLSAPIVETDKAGRKKMSRNTSGTPQGGVISPLLANIYLHWFDKAFHSETGPRRWADARLVRYADDFVVLARYVGERLRAFIEETIEAWLGLELNREKTRIVDLGRAGASFDFLGFTFRYDRDLHGGSWTYLNTTPSAKSLRAERQKLHALTASRYGFLPIPELIGRINKQLRGWSAYFDYGYPRKAFRAINHYVRRRLMQHLRRRSQRPFRPPKGRSYYKHLQLLGLVYL